jgi:hypothetical protein
MCLHYVSGTGDATERKRFSTEMCGGDLSGDFKFFRED